MTLAVGGSLTLTPTWAAQEIEWTVSDRSLASLDLSEGVDCVLYYCKVPWGRRASIQALGIGHVTVRVTADSRSSKAHRAVVELTLVGAPVASIRVAPDSL